MLSSTKKAPSLDDIFKAHQRIKPFIHRTPVLRCSSIDKLTGAKVYFKCENLQKVGAFKARGATNAVQSLPMSAVKGGVATHSSGNHAAALTWAAGIRGVPAHIVMPRTAPKTKKAAVAGYGAHITECEPTLVAREEGLKKVVAETGAVFIHPYDNEQIVAGQGTAALELLEDYPDLEIIIAPVGGGGLLSGTAITVSETNKGIITIGAEPAEADDAFRSFSSGEIKPSINPTTIADGLLTSLSELTFSVIRDKVSQIITVSESSIISAMRTVWERMKLIIEPSAAVPLAVVFENPERFSNRKVGIIFSGGNVDLERLPWLNS